MSAEVCADLLSARDLVAYANLLVSFGAGAFSLGFAQWLMRKGFDNS